ncbi:MAG: P-loop NTPase fold protein [Byssovorax sp.]
MTNEAAEPREDRAFIEPVGGYGRDFDDWERGAALGPLERIIVRAGDIVDDVVAVHGGEQIRHVAGGDGGTVIELTDDPLVAVTGSWGDYYGADHFHALSFHTASGKVHGPFGGGHRGDARPIDLRAPDGQIVAALAGRALRHSDGTEYISALGLWTITPPPRLDLDRLALAQPGYRSDAVDPTAPDLLGIQRDVDALCMVIASRQIRPPLSVGLFGDWGAGKSFFMAKLRRRVEELARRSDPGGAFCKEVVQVEFNAWHFADANLWASLVSRIYDALYAHVSGSSEEDELKKLKARLNEKLDKASKEEEAARAELTRAQEELGKARREREEREKRYDAFVGDMNALLADPGVKASAEAAGKALGVPHLTASYATLAETAQSLASLGNRGVAVRKMLLGSPLTRIAVPALVITLGVPALIHFVLGRFPGAVGSLDAFAAKAGAAVSAGALWLSAQIKRASEHVTTIEKAFADARKRREEQKEKAKGNPELQQYEAALAKEADAKKVLEEACARAEEIKRELAEQDPRRRLERLIGARATGDDYRKHLGIISAIRKDFEAMSAALSSVAEAEGKEPMRMILYIDDLDRCRPDRVVEVLEAVHMLLAFPLFVVVVGVDPRWLRRCLQAHYPELLGEVSDKATVRTSTPQDYLEKIFQIPFALRPISGSSFTSLMSDLLGPPAAETAPSAPRPAETAGADKAAPAPKPDAAAPPPPAADQAPAADAIETLLQRSKQLELTRDEHRDIRELAALFSGPRAVKRFVNTYRLIRARMAPGELRPFLKEKQYRATLVMLAIVTAYPNQASRFLRQLRWWLPKKLERGALTSWDDFMTTLERPRKELEKLDGLPLEELERALLDLGSPLAGHDDVEWRAMCRKIRAAVNAMPPVQGRAQMPFTEEVLERWLQEVSRYSFSFALAEL